eukprot:COSAG02_NODE_18807_length_917_cov_10.772616_2_plen_146_part_00
MRQGHTVREAVKLNNRLVQDDEAGGGENTAETKLGHVARRGSVHHETSWLQLLYWRSLVRLPLHAGRPEGALERLIAGHAGHGLVTAHHSRHSETADPFHLVGNERNMEHSGALTCVQRVPLRTVIFVSLPRTYQRAVPYRPAHR